MEIEKNSLKGTCTKTRFNKTFNKKTLIKSWNKGGY
ncbi:MAG: hypothetical protein ACI9K4_001729 [Polaribacter sp.]|jgi:hypothetical protein